MRIKTILLGFGLLLVIGMAMLAAETWAGEVYEVMLPGVVPDRVLSADEVNMLEMLGVLRLEVAKQLRGAEGLSCHLTVSSCGPNCWYTSCGLGSGSVICICSWGVDPATE